MKRAEKDWNTGGKDAHMNWADVKRSLHEWNNSQSGIYLHARLLSESIVKTIEPLYTERYVQWCVGLAIQLMGSLLPD